MEWKLCWAPKIPYRKLLRDSLCSGKAQKQSGGHGQYGDVKIQFEPRNDGETDLEFVDSIVGGVVPRNIPAVKRVLESQYKREF